MPTLQCSWSSWCIVHEALVTPPLSSGSAHRVSVCWAPYLLRRVVSCRSTNSPIQTMTAAAWGDHAPSPPSGSQLPSGAFLLSRTLHEDTEEHTRVTRPRLHGQFVLRVPQTAKAASSSPPTPTYTRSHNGRRENPHPSKVVWIEDSSCQKCLP